MKNNLPFDWLSTVQKTVESLDFGVVQIVVHSSKVVQIERTEKIRFALGTDKNGTTSERRRNHNVLLTNYPE